MSVLASNPPPPDLDSSARASRPAATALERRGLLSLKRFAVELASEGGAVPVVHGIDLDVSEGEALGFVGESGCGKSVTCLAALGLLGRKAKVMGLALLSGEDLVAATERRRSELRGGHIALVSTKRVRSGPWSCKAAPLVTLPELSRWSAA